MNIDDIFHRPEEQELLSSLGIQSYDDLFKHIPDSLKITGGTLPEPMQESEIKRESTTLEKKIFQGLSFTGFGLYERSIPEAVNHLSNIRNFVTSYTPYQPEVAQGTLQAVYEYQSYMSSLLSMDITNASLYDGATALVEAIRMALRVRGNSSKESVVVLSRGIHPAYMDVVWTYFPESIQKFLNVKILQADLDGQEGFTRWDQIPDKEKVDIVAFANPNVYGIVEKNWQDTRKIFPNAQILYGTNELHSVTFLPAPGDVADLVWGEAQSLGIPVSFGGPSLGFISAKEKYLRQMPGRFIGKTTAETPEGEKTDAYVITLSTREQHIRREKATSNICSNQSLMALRAGIYMASMGWEGLKNSMKTSLCHSKEILEKIRKSGNIHLTFPQGDYFHEISISHENPEKGIALGVEKHHLMAGAGYGKNLISYFSDAHTDTDIESYWNFIRTI